jgi:AcrR family transcriptional regulator
MSKPQHSDIIKKILSTATRHFALKGFAGARVDEIATDAKVNKATLYYQIGNKEDLYDTMLNDILTDVADSIEVQIEKLTLAEDKLSRFIKILSDKIITLKEFAPIMLREIASGGAHLDTGNLMQMARIFGKLDEILTLGNRTQTFRKVNPFLVHMIIVGSLMFYSAGEPVRAKLSTLDKLQVDMIPLNVELDIANQITDMILNSIVKQ